MEQEIFDWLNSQTKSQGTGLLVAPLSPEVQEDIPAPQESIPPEDPQDMAEDSPSDYEEGNVVLADDSQEVLDVPDDSQPEDEQDVPVESDDEHDEQDIPVDLQISDIQQPDNVEDILEIPQQDETQEVNDEITQDLPPEAWSYGDEDEYPTFIPETDNPEDFIPDSEADDDPAQQDHEWQERATGFTLSLDEPPPELWTHINDDDPEPDYEPTESLQGAAYVQIHGRNFTERLHHTLKHRKERAEERAQAEHEQDNSHPYIQKAVILASTLLMALGFAFLALWFIGRETPEGMKSRAQSLKEAGKFEEASEIYRRAHRRYPNVAEFLEGLSETSEKAGHPQTAKTAHDEYIKMTSPDTPPKIEPEVIVEPKPEPPKPAPVSLILNEKPLTFQDYLDEANHAYNIGMYNRAVINFFRAHEINPSDFRPYIGLAASYRMKGMYFDSKRILDEARRKFGRSPALDMETYFLREAK
ncbi:MAG: hypothetical protein IJG39_07205 [Synergistaceae bacterium]|nr:hypothetical protein [Synergistaceae bacterium]